MEATPKYKGPIFFDLTGEDKDVVGACMMGGALFGGTCAAGVMLGGGFPSPEFTGTMTLPPESVVLLGEQYGANGTEFTGELALEIPGASLDIASSPSISVEVSDPADINVEV